MEIARIDVTGVREMAIIYRPIPVGMIGGTVRFEYSDHLWDGLNKTVVFQAGDITKDVLNPGELVTIPPEITMQVRRNVLVGVYGTDAQQNLVIPTLWATIGRVHEATSPSGDTSTDDSLPVWAQLQGMIGNLDELDTTAKNNLVAAINEAMTKGVGGGEVDQEYIQQIVDEYLAANPPAQGEDGRGIVSIARTAGDGSPGTTDTYTITYTDGGTDYLTVYNGRNGEDGNDGVTPHIGANGNWYLGDIDTGKQSRGEDGTSVTVERVSESTAPGGSNVVTFSDGSSVTVKNGADGQAGHTPVKGTDYFTEADKAELVDSVLAALPAAEGVSY